MKLNAIDKVIGYFSPAAGLRRARARAAMTANYEGAMTGRRTAGWHTSGTSANSENSRALPSLRDRSRDHIRNNALASNAQDKWVDSVVGHGITCQWEDQAVQEKWDAWSAKCSADGLPHFEAVQDLACMAEFESGEVLLRLRPRRRGDGPWPPFQIQVLESDYLDSSKTQTTDSGYIINGVEYDAIGRKVAYWLFQHHPGDVSNAGVPGSIGTLSKRVPASQISHLYRTKRPGQSRGVPRLAPVTLPIRDMADWEEAELLRKRTEACITAAVTSPESDTFEFSPQVTDAAGNEVSSFEPGMLLKLKPGEDVSFNQPAYAGGYDDYKTSRQRDFAAGIQVPFELLTGNYSKSNYSSSRMGIVAFERTIRRYQWNVFIPAVCEWAANEFIRQLELYEGPVTNKAHEWTPPAFNLLDRPEMVGQAGNNPERQMEQVEEYADRLRDAGVDFFSGAVAAAEANNGQGAEGDQQ